MAGLVGEFEVKLDAKGRFLFPSGLRKQLSPATQRDFMLNKGFEDCLTLYPLPDFNPNYAYRARWIKPRCNADCLQRPC